MGLASAAKKFLGAWRLESNRVFRLLCTSNPALSGRTNNNEAKSKSHPLCNLQIKYKLHIGKECLNLRLKAHPGVPNASLPNLNDFPNADVTGLVKNYPDVRI